MFSLRLGSKHEKGQGLVEYGIILALVTIAVIGSLKFLGPNLCDTFNTISSSLPGGNGSGSSCGGAAAPSGPQDFGTSQWKNGFDQATPVNNYCASEGSGRGYNFYSVNGGSYTYYIASGQPMSGSQYTFMHTGTCP